MSKTFPRTNVVYDQLGLKRPAWFGVVSRVAEMLVPILPWVWGIIAFILVVWWFRSRRASTIGKRPWLPTIAGVRGAGRMATFAELLATLVDQQVPLDQALTLAAAAGGGAELRRAAITLVDSVRRGDLSAPAPPGFPPMLAWLIVTSARQPHLSHALRQSAYIYRRRAVRMSIFLGTYLPIFLSAALGGAFVLFYVALTLVPFYTLLNQLGRL
jgi:type II secretory pathway component PulF